MGWFQQRDSGRWTGRYRDRNDKVVSRTFATKAEAKRWVAQMEADLARGTYVDPRGGQTTFGDWHDRWAAGRVVRRTTEASAGSRLRTHVVPRWRDYKLEAITPSDVRAWVAELQALGLAPETVRGIYQLFATIMRAAVDDGLIAATPCRRIPLPKPGADERVYLTADQVAQLVGATPERYRALVLTAAYTGCRWGELAGLKAGRLDLLRGRLEVVETLEEVAGRFTYGVPKSEASRRTVSLPKHVVAALRAHVEEYGLGDDGLVCSGPKGRPLSRNRFRVRVWTPAIVLAQLRHECRVRGLDTTGSAAALCERLTKAGHDIKRSSFPVPRFHDLRHTHVALLIAGGVPVKAIQHRLGHASITTTMNRYGHLLPDVDAALTGTLEAQAARAATPKDQDSATRLLPEGPAATAAQTLRQAVNTA
jgi:integrase